MSKTPEILDGSGAIPPHLRDALVAAQAEHRMSQDALREAVCAYVDQMRARGISQSKVLRSVTSMVAQLTNNSTAVGAQDNDLLLSTMIEWCRERWHASRHPT